MPEFFKEWLEGLNPTEKAELGEYVLTTDDNEVTSDIVGILDPE